MKTAIALLWAWSVPWAVGVGVTGLPSGLEDEAITLFTVAAALFGGICVGGFKGYRSGWPAGVMFGFTGAVSGVFVGANGVAMIADFVPGVSGLSAGGGTMVFAMVSPFFFIALLRKLDDRLTTNNPATPPKDTP